MIWLPMGRQPALWDAADLYWSVTTASNTFSQTALMMGCVSPSLSGSGTIGATTALYVASRRFSSSTNFWINALNAYVWRPTTGTKVGTIINNVRQPSIPGWVGPTLGNSGPTWIGQTETAFYPNIGSAPVNYQAGDCIVAEVWAKFSQSNPESSVCECHYGGSHEELMNNAVIGPEGCASFIAFYEDVLFATERPIKNSLMMKGYGV